ncbi:MULTISPECIES: FecR family protein [unclassified Carboxylicivirga]|uniref:FecR family protein n=1 Tax=Carboxylicivirga TaxID=1628153 RepID=UPI003D35496B
MSKHHEHINEKIKQCYTSSYLSEPQLSELEDWLDQVGDNSELDRYLQDKWEESGASESVVVQKPVLRRLWGAYRLAAAILLLPLLGAAFMMLLKQSDAEVPQNMIVSSEKGNRVHFTLPDGTEVLLNGASSFSYNTAYAYKNRSVELKGEAFFKVNKNTELPFVVQADSLYITALGTEFMVRNHEDEDFSEAMLVEGSIEVNDLKSSMVLQPGEAIIYKKGKSVLSKKTFQPGIDIAWTQGVLVFNNDDIQAVARKIEQWYGVKVNYNAKDFNNERLTLKLRKEETLFNLLNIASEVINMNYRMANDTVVIIKQ